jgi:hypothetical protein
VNGFDPQTGEGGVQAAYLNLDDLGFGRNMNCLQRGEQVACYVTNYGDVRQEPHTANMAYHDNESLAVATVAMEYGPIEREVNSEMTSSLKLAPVVKFFVFAGGEANGPRRLKADLDGYQSGRDFVPYVCVHCHGGQYTLESKRISESEELLESENITNTFIGDLGASFLPFDMASFELPSDCVTAVDSLCSAERFRQLNEIVSSTALTNRTVTLISGWYPPTSTNAIQAMWRPQGWTSPQAIELYDKVIARSCRTCHLNLSQGKAFFDLYTTTTLSKLRNNFNSTVFSTTRTMPHAYIPDYNLWCGRPSATVRPIDTVLTVLAPIMTTEECD